MTAHTLQVREIDISKQAGALRFVTLANLLLFFGCGWWLVQLLIAPLFYAELRDYPGLFAGTLTATFLAICVYTSWKSFATIDGAALRRTFYIFPFLIVFLLFCGLSGALSAANQSGAEMFLTVYGELSMAAFSIAATIALISAWRLRRSPFQLINISLSDLLPKLYDSGSVAILKSIGARKLKKINTQVAVILFLSGIVLLLSVQVVRAVVYMTPDLEHPVAVAYGRLEPFAMIGGFFLLLMSRRYFQVSADALLAIDKRNPVVFLRAFDDDEKRNFMESQTAFFDFSLEDRISNNFRPLGPFIAIGSPTETVPLPGAARAKLSDSEWQERVMRWISNASVIIMYAGKTHWVNWELARIIEKERVQSLILIMPEGKKGRTRQRLQDLGSRIDRIKEVFINTIWSSALSASQKVQGQRALLFGRDGSIIVIRSRYGGRGSYHLAALVGLYVIRNEPQWCVAAKVTVRCPNCSRGLRLPARRSGQVRCPNCGGSFQANT